MYRLQAVIAGAGVLVSDRVVPLAQDLVLLSAVPDSEQLVEWSLRGPVAFVDAEFFGRARSGDSGS
ncbi:hypothetical protein OG205_38905 [Lentzea sp. NBC_00516]|uniref:hypothetical protein n=1 Tax=Lentzea sp. NBC_00516 TaxID=2903582 RepID=UPI002E81B685|nr:hypothetical protein [Lentzea sp. NBC_00516]WUD23965.1 hypothetical protein OG205_38905 [Lentzea sp. NBC_00516]